MGCDVEMDQAAADTERGLPLPILVVSPDKDVPSTIAQLRERIDPLNERIILGGQKRGHDVSGTREPHHRGTDDKANGKIPRIHARHSSTKRPMK
jgi:hypothetical protein